MYIKGKKIRWRDEIKAFAGQDGQGEVENVRRGLCLACELVMADDDDDISFMKLEFLHFIETEISVQFEM